MITSPWSNASAVASLNEIQHSSNDNDGEQNSVLVCSTPKKSTNMETLPSDTPKLTKLTKIQQMNNFYVSKKNEIQSLMSEKKKMPAVMYKDVS